MSWQEKYDLTIGLEIHLQLDLLSKAFAPESNAVSTKPNSLISDVSLALPGSLPVLNLKLIDAALKMAIALNCEIQSNFFFDRKHYFYADLPKGYQITQDTQHYCLGGNIPIFRNHSLVHIKLHHIHMEEDAGKSIHDQNPDFTFLDYNRAGTPLLEIVTEPDLHNIEDVSSCIDAIQQFANYLEISTADMEKGKLRCDCNVSLSLKGSNQLGTRCEIKNLNSKKFARKAILIEAKRQAILLDSGGSIVQQTLNYDPQTNRNTPIRDKETLHDYRYLPDPDLPKFTVSKEKIEELTLKIPTLPHQQLSDLISQFNLNFEDAELVTKTSEEANFIKMFLSEHSKPKNIFNIYIQGIRPEIQNGHITYDNILKIKPEIYQINDLIEDKKLASSDAMQHLIPILIKGINENSPQTDIFLLAKDLGILINKDSGEMEMLIEEILESFPEKVNAYQKGKKGLIGFFMGEYMRRAKSKPDPQKLKDNLSLKLK